MANTFDLVAGDEKKRFDDAKEAGAAFYAADPAKRPSVIQGMDNNAARIMAETGIRGTYENGEQRFVKMLPNSHAVDADFRAGYMGALEKSVSERLQATDWEKVKPDHPQKAPNLDGRLYDDLETLSRSNPQKAVDTWAEHAPAGVTAPAIVDPKWKEQVAQARDVSTEIDRTMRGPEYGITQIDGKPATAVRYERVENDGEHTYNLSFMMDNKTAARLKGLDADQLEDAVGEKNAKAIQQAETEKGSLKGSALSNEYGMSPDEVARRIADKEARKAAELDASNADLPAEKNVIANESERLQTIDRDEIVKRAAQVRESERLQREAEQAALGQQAESKRIKVENLGEKAQELDDANRLADRVGAPSNESAQINTEREKNRQIEIMDRVHQQFRVSGSKFHFKDQPNRVAFNDKGQRLVSASNDERVAQAMATVADAKGWKTIRVSGHPEFQREVWLEGNLRGLEVRGYKPNEQDIKDLDARRERLSKNVVEREPDAEKQKKAGRSKQGQEQGRAAEQGRASAPLPGAATIGAGVTVGTAAAKAPEALRGYSGRVLEHGSAPYNHDPAENQNYYVKLATDKGEQTVWGVDLKRAMAERGAKKGDEVTLEFRGKQAVTVNAVERDEQGKVIGTKEIETNRNTWEVQKSDKHKVVEAVAAKAINERFKDPAQREAAMQAVNQRLGERAQAGSIPSVSMYDKQAPSKAAEIERARPVVERNTERTR